MRRGAVLVGLIALTLAATQPAERFGRALYEAGLPGFARLLLEGDLWRGATLYAEGRFDEAAGAFAEAPVQAAAYDQGTALARAGRLGEAIDALDEALRRDPNDEDARYNLALVEALKAKREGAKTDAQGIANANAVGQRRSRQALSQAPNDVDATGDGAAGDRDSGREAPSPGTAQVEKAGKSRQSDYDSLEARGSVGASEGRGRPGSESAKVAQSFDDAVKLPKRSFMQQGVQPNVQWLQTIPDDPGRYLRLKLAAERVARAERGLAAPEGTDQW